LAASIRWVLSRGQGRPRPGGQQAAERLGPVPAARAHDHRDRRESGRHTVRDRVQGGAEPVRVIGEHRARPGQRRDLADPVVVVTLQ
jgi:hypothetical protein